MQFSRIWTADAAIRVFSYNVQVCCRHILDDLYTAGTYPIVCRQASLVTPGLHNSISAEGNSSAVAADRTLTSNGRIVHRLTHRLVTNVQRSTYLLLSGPIPCSLSTTPSRAVHQPDDVSYRSAYKHEVVSLWSPLPIIPCQDLRTTSSWHLNPSGQRHTAKYRMDQMDSARHSQNRFRLPRMTYRHLRLAEAADCG